MEQGKPVSHIAAGLLIASVVILLSLLLTYTTGGGGPQGGWISYLIIVIGLVLFIQRYAKAHDYSLPFGDLFSYGFKASTIVTLVFVAFLVVLSFVSPETKKNVMDATRAELEKRKGITDKDIETVLNGINHYFWLVLIGTSMFFFALVGAVGSLLGAAIAKKRPANSHEQTSY